MIVCVFLETYFCFVYCRSTGGNLLNVAPGTESTAIKDPVGEILVLQV